MKKILVVNNDYDTMTLLQAWLEKKGYAVKITGNASGVLSLINEFRPDLVLVDVLQNKVIDEINKEIGNHVPVLLMTGYTLRKHTKHFQVADSIEKPFDLELLERKIKDLIIAHETVQ